MLTGFEDRFTVGTPRAGEYVLSDLRSDLIRAYPEVHLPEPSYDELVAAIRRAKDYIAAAKAEGGREAFAKALNRLEQLGEYTHGLGETIRWLRKEASGK